MEARIVSLIEEIKQERQNRRHALPMQPPASRDRLQQLQEQVTAKLDYRLPEAYLGLLGIVDGIDSNGILLYASATQPLVGYADRAEYTIEGFIEANLIWRTYEPNKQFIFFAETGDVVYCHNLITDKFQIMDRIAQEVDSDASVFITCEELLGALLNHMLDRYGDKEEGEA
ncbi:YrhA family protein [Hymenobacter terrenus]|uniref:YrhA family protein n=1 Tax=Hymenobacter terrenus TaxID=1629124 RepID=UPI000ABE781A|nr:YrhA family protein [Hymenobacter terrenus]